MIAIIDYGAGNLLSVKKAFEFLNVKCQVVSTGSELQDAERVVLPGVGAFGAAMEKLHDHDFVAPVKDWIQADKPFLGICLGLQLLFERSTESTEIDGLAAFPGECHQFQQGKVPQIGWNQIIIEKESKLKRYYRCELCYRIYMPSKNSDICHDFLSSSTVKP